MEKFLETVARYIFTNNKSNLSDICVIFPNRRSGVFFTEYLRKLPDKPVIGPKVTTVHDFIAGFSEKQMASRLKLISVLFEVFREETKTSETFDEFYFWGEVLLSDFSDIDKYLANPAEVFRNVADLKEIDSHFSFLEESQVDILRRFWGTLGNWEKYRDKEEFLKLWKILYPVYKGFRKKLEEAGIAYDGMLYREIAERVMAGQELVSETEKYYVVGLNVLNECENVVFKHLKTSRQAHFLWDYDKFYLDDIKNEAGYFMRRNITAFPPPVDFAFGNNSFGSDKEIEFVSVASLYGQSQIIPRCISGKEITFDNTAIVLADESLLFPVLAAIPESVKAVNVTMGYPVKNSALFGFISLLATLIKNTRIPENGDCFFYYRFVFDILNHQLLGGVESGNVHRFMEDAKKNNRIYLRSADLNFSELHRLIFAIPQKVSEYGTYFRSVLKSIFFYFRESQPENKVLPELVISIFNAIEKLDLTVSEVEAVGSQTISAGVFFRLMNQYLGQESVSYEGEPLSGLQVMGILETRCLDFENVLIIGFNEDHWPRSAVAPSCIPYHLRRVFGLPSIDEQNALYAYYFYRLIQRSGKITATYNTIKDGINTGELSRFGYQIIYDSPHEVLRNNLGFRFRSSPAIPLSGSASENSLNILLERFGSEKPLSPSALNTYISCKYRFYLRYIAGLPEGEEITEEIDSRLFGSIFHKTVEGLYSFAGKDITKDRIEGILKNKHQLGKVIKQAFASEYFKSEQYHGQIPMEGNVRLAYEFIKSYITQLLKVDLKITPFEIISLEEKYTLELDITVKGELTKITLGGIIDRIDKVNGNLRVIDYKTGSVNSMSLTNIGSLFDRTIRERKKEAFQALLYSLIISKRYFPGENILPGIYALRNLFNENFSPYFKNGNQRVVFAEVKEEFEGYLKELVTEIFSEKNNFTQTEITELCRTCPYKVICHRI